MGENGPPVLWVGAGAVCIADGVVKGHWLLFGLYVALAVIVAVTRPRHHS
jgi:hypothetical protein